MNAKTSPVSVAVLMAPAIGRLEVDARSGVVSEDDRGATISVADAAALEVALTLGSLWNAEVVAVSVGGEGASVALREGLAVGVGRAVHVVAPDDADPATVAAMVAEVVSSLTNVLVLSGVHGVDVASAATPALLAERLGVAQALGLVAITGAEPGSVVATRRLDGGARERLRVAAPAVVSVEGGVARLRRAPLRAAMAAASARVDVVTPERVVRHGGHGPDASSLRPRPYRPRSRVVDAPQGDDALERIRTLTGAGGVPTSSRSVEADPEVAARLILDKLAEWGIRVGDDTDD